MPDLPEQPRPPARGSGLVPEGNLAPAEPRGGTEAGSDTAELRGNGAQPKERRDTDMDETTAGTVDEVGRSATPAGAESPTRAVGNGGLPVTERPRPATGETPGGEPLGERGGEAGDEPEAKAEAGDGEAGDGEGGDGSDGSDEAPAATPRKRRRPLRSAIEWVVVIGGALIVALLIRTFLLQAFWIPTASMEPTLEEGDRVLVNKLSYDLHDVNRGDIIVFERPEEPGAEAPPEDDIKDLIKRVIGLPGETIESRDGVVYIDGERLDEPYLPGGTTTNNLPPTPIPEGEVFVMGDNRGNSTDSRTFGSIDEGLIVGRAFVRIYPLDDIGGL